MDTRREREVTSEEEMKLPANLRSKADISKAKREIGELNKDNTTGI